MFPVAVPVADIKAVVTGKDCPHMKEKGALKQNKVSKNDLEYQKIKFSFDAVVCGLVTKDALVMP